MKAWRDNQLFGEQTFRRWFLSSLCIILFFILFGLILYLVALDATEKTVSMAQSQSADQTRTLIDNRLLDIRKSVSALVFNEKLVTSSYIEPPFTGEDYYALHKAGEQLRGIFMFGNVSDIYVYYHSCACFISSYSLITITAPFIEDKFGMKPQEWVRFVMNRQSSEWVKLNGRVYLITPLKRDNLYSVSSWAIVEINLAELRDLLIGGDSDLHGDLGFSYIVSSDHQLIETTGDEGQIPYSYGMLDPGEHVLGNQVVHVRKIKQANWEYISVVPVHQYFKKIYDLRQLLYAYLGIGMLLAIGIVYVETRRRYSPILSLSRRLFAGGAYSGAQDAQSIEHRDIFKSLQLTIDSIVDNNRKLASMLQKDKELRLSQTFSLMIRDHSRLEDHQGFFREHFAMPFRQGLVTAVRVLDPGRKLNELPVPEQEHILLICLNNICSELLGKQYSCFFWKHMGLTGVIWSDQPINQAWLAGIGNILEQTRGVIKTYFDADVLFALSDFCDASSSLSSAYHKAQESENYAAMTGKSGIIYYDSCYTHPLPEWNRVDIIRAEQDFMSYMMEHNYERAKEKLLLIIGYYRYTDGVSIQLLQCRMFGLINLVLNAIEMKKTPEEEMFYSKINPVQRLLNASTIQQLEEEIMKIIEEMILYHEEREETTEWKLEMINQYIESHYMDQTLSVQQLAERYQLSVSYLSRLYKQHYQIGILEAIHRCRIRHAKALLRERPDLSIAQIADKVGYGNVQTLMRIFKKMEDRTPGQYRATAAKLGS